MPYCPCALPASQAAVGKGPRHTCPQSEDWSNISDLVERRKIQNRIAQRKYRKKLRKKLALLNSITTSGSSLRGDSRPARPHDLADSSCLKVCPEVGTPGLHHERDRDHSFTPLQQHYNDEPLNTLLPVPSPSPTSGPVTAQNTDPSLNTFYSSTAVAARLATSPPVEYSTTKRSCIDGSPFYEGYLAMKGPSVAQRWHL
ncbi:hypothetical protein BU25DRAFT_481990 [Macroventuria anomochaeta]|uniref:Uncharacterized protein n=1 Tax=Macroventuria anomochaeta TaxID=301207 RepID=A0ACB6RJC6_9PLEO|nr:uncharacterized protein BU25DRAFT_481990 [Macroventuria anomochaeta]KAF2621838.1 hypothetical protein BU25DRAFT_481990 [Macroventuria anomochaeta]